MQNTVKYRALQAGDMGAVIAAQARLYWREYGFDAEFEALLCEIGARFLRRFDASAEAAWVATVDEQIVGAVFLVRASKTQAQLRMLHVEPTFRGHGIGRHLVNNCISFAREKKYSSIKLWTNSVLLAARKIYVDCGFALVKEETHASFGQQLVGQYWRLRLR